MSRRLDPDRPLWEVYFVEGLEGGRVALLSKSHQILVDGISTVDLGQVLLDVDPGPRQLVRDDWVARHEPTPAGWRRAPSPSRPATRGSRSARCAATPRRSAARVGERRRPVRRRRRCALQPARPTPESPFNVEPSAQRRVVLRAHLAQGLPQGPPGARRHRQRRHPGHPVRRDPGVADDPGRVGRRRPPAAGAGPDERDRRGARADLARLPGRRPPRRPADRRGVARRTPPPGLLRPARAQRDRPGGGGRPDRRGRRASRRPPSTRSARGWPSRRPGATSTW